ncbi:probable ADP-ribosylation factor GTPase-activating protein AGD11 isoform X2 [Oryza sativa Japonica Group]|uniref:probable ADP-ribosylation factor GTPase-activating protein AGD11 isoform X2 n=1 Tax=Oryza sativa subsp. japonica TaxID=39947 RepID=UPI0027ACC3B5|nr:hypothetical protein DAI22_05g144600 [Oryza sativa Japonica Group]
MHRQDVRTKEAEEERMEENNLLHFLDSPNAHYRRKCEEYVSAHDDEAHCDASDVDLANARERLEHLLKQPANKFCADCGTPDPKWAALPFGALICIKCSGTHRSLGVHISKVISVNLDEWTDEEVNCLAGSGGNATVNTRYEAFLPENFKKPRHDCTTEERCNFIRKKYEFQQFVTDPQFSCPLRLNTKHAPDKNQQQQNCSARHGFGHAFRNSWKRKDTDNKGLKKMTDVGMVEFVGLIKVDIRRGTNLAVRDVMSSDPYVMLNLGHQTMKTKVIKNTLNPVWNERLMLSIPHPVPPLKLLRRPDGRCGGGHPAADRRGARTRELGRHRRLGGGHEAAGERRRHAGQGQRHLRRRRQGEAGHRAEAPERGARGAGDRARVRAAQPVV